MAVRTRHLPDSSLSEKTNSEKDPMSQPLSKPTQRASFFTRSDFELIVCALGIYSCYLYYGVLQERIYKTPYAPDNAHFSYSSFLVCVQTATNAALAALVLAFVPQKPHSTPIHKYFVVALTYLSAMLFSFSALRHMSYPMQALGKSCKMIPVMLLGIVIRKKRYKPYQFACVGLITAGVALFSVKRYTDQETHTSAIGLLLLFGSLLMDGITGPVQETVVARYGPSTHQLMCFQNMASVVWLLLLMVGTGELMQATRFVYEHPSVLRDILAFSFVSACGQNFIFYTVRNFSALTCTTITTTRKFFTILISIIIYKHTLSPRQWAAVFMVFTGIIWEVVMKHRAKQNLLQENPKKQQ